MGRLAQRQDFYQANPVHPTVSRVMAHSYLAYHADRRVYKENMRYVLYIIGVNTDKQSKNKIYEPIERRWQDVNIIVHHPKDPESLSVLKKRVAVVHAEAVLKYINKLPCAKEQKIEMINSLKEKGLPR